MVTFVNGCVNHMRKRKIIMCCLLLAIIIPYIFLAVTNGVFRIGDFIGEQWANNFTLATVIISGLSAVAIYIMISNSSEWIKFAKDVKLGKIKEAKLSCLGELLDINRISRKTDYGISITEFWELDVAVENNNHFIEHAVLRCKLKEKTDISRPEINIVSKTISIPYGFDKTELEKMEIDIGSLQEVVGK